MGCHIMGRKNKPESKIDGVATLKETPAEKAVFGILKIIIAVAVTFTVIIICKGTSKFGFKGYFQRIGNYVHSFSSDYYDIRVGEFDENTIEVNGSRRVTNENDRNVAACLNMDESHPYFTPGAFGTTTFYIVPKDSEQDLDVQLELNVFGITQMDNGEYARMIEAEPTQSVQKVENLLDGHVLFFEGKDETYRTLIKDGKMTYRTSEHKADMNSNNEYKVTVFWVWPEYYNQLVDQSADGALIADASTAEEVKDYIAAHPNNFFYEGDGSSKSDESSQQYDNADLLIHQNVDGFGFEVIALN